MEKEMRSVPTYVPIYVLVHAWFSYITDLYYEVFLALAIYYSFIFLLLLLLKIS